MNGPLIYIVDDQPAVCLALREMLSVLGYAVETFGSAAQLLERLQPGAIAPGCIITDVRMPGMDGLELMQALSARGIRLPVILISGHGDVPMAVAAIKAGAEDFIEKPVDDRQLVAAINRCLAQSYEQLAERATADDLGRRFKTLTPREIEVFDLVAQGCTSQAIGLRLGISPRTVESHRVQIMDKLQAPSVAVLVRQAVRLGRLKP